MPQKRVELGLPAPEGDERLERRPAAALRALDPYLPLERGYSLAHLPSGKLLRSVSDVKPGVALNVALRDGRVDAVVREVFSEEKKSE